jgi:hypothetical protein
MKSDNQQQRDVKLMVFVIPLHFHMVIQAITLTENINVQIT